jgi:iron complex outermembrane receptor protein
MKSKRFFVMILMLALPASPLLADEAKPAKETKFEEMVVTATRTEKSVADVPGSVSVVSKKEMEKRNIQSVDESLNLLTGVFDNRIKGLMGTTSTVTFRGLSGSGRTLLLLDGMPLNDAYSSGQQWGGLYAQDMQRIEVVRGPSSNLYGGSAMGGVINMMTAMPTKREFTLSGGYGDAWNVGESMQRLWTTHASYGDRIGKFSIYTAFGYRSTDGYPTAQVFGTPPANTTGWTQTTDNKGTARTLIGDTGDNGWWDYGASVRAQYDFSDSANARFSWLRAANKYFYDNPHTYLRSTDTGAPVFPSNVRSFLSGDGSTIQDTYTISAEAPFGNGKGRFLFGINDQSENWYTSSPSTGTITSLEYRAGTKTDTPNRTYFTDLQISAPIMEKHVLTGGFSFKYETADSNNFPVSNVKDPDSVNGASTQWGGGVSKTYSGYLQGEIALHNTLTLYVGLRDDYWVSSDGYDGQTATATTAAFSNQYSEKTKNSFCPKGALVWKPLDGTILRISGGKAFRSPPLNQLYKTWISSSSSKVYYSNPYLNPETVLSWDVGAEQNLWKGAKIKATYFENYLSDMIYNVQIGSGTTIPGFTDWKYLNIGGAESKGVELEVEQSFGKYLRLFTNYTYTDSAITEFNPKPVLVGKQLTQAPRHMLNAGVDASYGPASLFSTWRYVSKRYGQDDNSDVVNGVYGSYDPFMVWDIKTAYKLSDRATVSLSINNVLNEKYFVYYVSPGRSWFANLDFKF